MRTFLTIALVLLTQNRTQPTTTFAYQGFGFDPAAVHQSANTFANRVGKELKARYPSRVSDAHVKLSFGKRNGRQVFILTWGCIITPSTPAQADFWFDRRGTLLSGRDLAKARSAVQTELMMSGKIQALKTGFQRQYGNFSMVAVSQDWGRDDSGTVWYIEEHFVTARR